MKIAHVLRKYVADEWGGTETAVKQLADGLLVGGDESVVFCPRLPGAEYDDPGPLGEQGHPIHRYRARLPIWGLSRERHRQLESVGGNLLSLDLIRQLKREPDLDVIHSHTLNRIGGAALRVARQRGLPFVVTIHGGYLDLPAAARESLDHSGGLDWGKPFGLFLKSREVLTAADAVLTVNPVEAERLREKHPGLRVVETRHGVDANRFAGDARSTIPDLGPGPVAVILGRIDPIKNQGAIVAEWTRVRDRHPEAQLVLMGAETDPEYASGLKNSPPAGVRFVGGLDPDDPRIAGYLQRADVVIVPSKSETFGLVILEAWCAGAAVLSSRTSGAVSLIREGENGLLFDLDDPSEFHRGLDAIFNSGETRDRMGSAGRAKAIAEFSLQAAAQPVRDLYRELRDIFS